MDVFTVPNKKSATLMILTAAIWIHYTCPCLKSLVASIIKLIQIEIKFDGPEIHIVCVLMKTHTGVSVDVSIEFHYA